ncbi:MAG: hypothetical protein K0S18_289 [Anaerocolumna sp.]|jgi:hypothetical protein|nr:hypothetical protein [Anaerocolumna sp.]
MGLITHKSYFFAQFRKVGDEMKQCLLQGIHITPVMPSPCNRCSLYLNTCMPLIVNSYICGECDYEYCEWCDAEIYDECYIESCKLYGNGGNTNEKDCIKKAR